MEWIKFGGVWKCETIEHPSYTNMHTLYLETTGIRLDLADPDKEVYEKYRNWSLTHPKFLENLETSKAFQKAKAASESQSFVGLGLNKPGVLLKVKDQTILLGHTNADGQDSGCCTTDLLSENDIVVEYAILITF